MDWLDDLDGGSDHVLGAGARGASLAPSIAKTFAKTPALGAPHVKPAGGTSKGLASAKTALFDDNDDIVENSPGEANEAGAHVRRGGEDAVPTTGGLRRELPLAKLRKQQKKLVDEVIQDWPDTDTVSGGSATANPLVAGVHVLRWLHAEFDRARRLMPASKRTAKRFNADFALTLPTSLAVEDRDRLQELLEGLGFLTLESPWQNSGLRLTLSAPLALSLERRVVAAVAPASTLLSSSRRGPGGGGGSAADLGGARCAPCAGTIPSLAASYSASIDSRSAFCTDSASRSARACLRRSRFHFLGIA